MKRLLFLTAVIVLLTFGVCAEVVGGSCGENTGWYLDTETGLFCLVGKGDMTDYNPYSIPENTPPWYAYRAFIKTVEINEGITSVGNYSFYECQNLTEVIMPDTITVIGISAFRMCEQLTQVDIPKSVKIISAQAFMNTNLISVKLHEGVTDIDSHAFRTGRSLKEITIPDSAVNISPHIFSGVLISDANATVYCGNRSFAKWFAIENGNKVAVNDGNCDITVYINGKCLDFDVPPYIKNGRTLVPFRAIFEELGAEVEWIEESQTVNALWDELPISLKIGSNVLKRKNREFTLDVPAEIKDGRTMVPLRAVAEACRCEVTWHEATSTVIIKTEDYEYPYKSHFC